MKEKHFVVLHESIWHSAAKDAISFGVAIGALVINKVFLDYESFAFVVALILALFIVSSALKYAKKPAVTREEAIRRIDEFYGEEA